MPIPEQAEPELFSELGRREGSRLPQPAFHDPKHHIKIYQGDCLEVLAGIPENCVDLIFADPPYFLSNDGITCHAGRMVSVNKGEWDRSRGRDALGVRTFYYLSCRGRILACDGVGDNTRGAESEVPF